MIKSNTNTNSNGGMSNKDPSIQNPNLNNQQNPIDSVASPNKKGKLSFM